MDLEHRYDRLWERLLQVLDTLGTVDASAPGRVRLTVERHDIEIVMTDQEWSELVGMPYGSFPPAARDMLHAISVAQSQGLGYVVYDTYELHACATPEKPVQAEMEDDRRRVEEHLRAHPGAKVQMRAFPPSPDEP